MNSTTSLFSSVPSVQASGSSVWSAVLCFLFSSLLAPAQFVDLFAQIRVDKWGTHDEGFRTIHVAVGTNSWRMDGDLYGNCDMTY